MAQVYNIRTINGIAPPIPMEFRQANYDLDLDSYTTASGKLVRNKVAEKQKFFCTFPPMFKNELQILLNMIKGDTLTIVYESLFDSSLKTGTFYRGDIEVEPDIIYNEANTNVLFKPFTINFIEY